MPSKGSFRGRPYPRGLSILKAKGLLGAPPKRYTSSRPGRFGLPGVLPTRGAPFPPARDQTRLDSDHGHGSHSDAEDNRKQQSILADAVDHSAHMQAQGRQQTPTAANPSTTQACSHFSL